MPDMSQKWYHSYHIATWCKSICCHIAQNFDKIKTCANGTLVRKHWQIYTFGILPMIKLWQNSFCTQKFSSFISFFFTNINPMINPQLLILIIIDQSILSPLNKIVAWASPWCSVDTWNTFTFADNDSCGWSFYLMKVHVDKSIERMMADEMRLHYILTLIITPF